MKIMARKKPPDPPGAPPPGDRHRNPKVGFHPDGELLAALRRYVAETEPRPSLTSVMEAALAAYLRSRGYWPPPPPAQS
jgi:hypothetical protein